MNIAVIFAGGVGKRMRSKEKPKQFLEIHGKPIIIHTIDIFEQHPDIDAIVVACVEEWISYFNELLSKFNINKVKKIVAGGTSGQESIYNGLCAAESIAIDEKNVVLIHDGVRPLINSKVISDNINNVKKYNSAITTVKVKETIMVVDESSMIKHIPERKNSRLARAPQSFWLEDILSAHRKAIEEGMTEFIDSCSMMQYYGNDLFLVDGPEENIKVTTPDDFYILRAILDAKENSQIYGFEERVI